jgi:hypothetical protein
MPEAVDHPTDHKHCYHITQSRQFGNTLHETAICCHCGHLMTRSYECKLGGAYPTTPHGPFYQPIVTL